LLFGILLELFISLICCIPGSPDINRQIKMLNRGIQPDPIFSVFHGLQYKGIVYWLIS
jgi:hypothetical protein